MSEEKWIEFVNVLVQQKRPKVFVRVQLAQAILESGRGSSELFREHLNPYGFKYRKEMGAIAQRVEYKGDFWCKFENVEDAVAGYWTFLDRSVYHGWHKCEGSGEFLKHLINCGYTGDDGYFEKIVSLFPEVDHIWKLIGD